MEAGKFAVMVRKGYPSGSLLFSGNRVRVEFQCTEGQFECRTSNHWNGYKLERRNSALIGSDFCIINSQLHSTL